MISYTVDPATGLILVKTEASDVDWGYPQLTSDKATPFRAGVVQYQTFVDQAGVDYHLPSQWIDAIAWAESQWDPRAKSPAGALGIMQVMPFHYTAAELPNALDPQTSIRKGASILSANRAGYRDLVQVASMYNAGGPSTGGPWTNDAWSAAGRKAADLSRWGYACEPGYIDRVVAAYNTDVLQRRQA